VITDIYAAGEAPIEGVTGERLSEAISASGHKNVVYSSTLQGGIEYMLRESRSGDAVMTIGAGSVGRVTEELALLLDSRVSTRHHAH
jgi:UDP-N-acetylmuramate--alanine ligase